MNILQIVTGGIAAYKSVELLSLFKKSGHNVKVVMTNNAKKFVTPLTFQSISKNSVYTDTFLELDSSNIQHIELCKWADKIVVAPATANIISKIANGIGDDLSSTLLLAVKDFSKIYIAPAMNTNMYNNPIIQENIEKLKKLNFNIIEPKSGILACGDEGIGKLADLDCIFSKVLEVNKNKSKLNNKNVLITAGATKEYIDPVRFLTNPASGKMGFELAKCCIKNGAKVTMIVGSEFKFYDENINIIKVTSAEDMFIEVEKQYKNFDIIFKSAAVSDYTPVKKYENKMKKTDDDLFLELTRTKDILKFLGENKLENQILIGFAAETNNVLDYAKGKLIKKKLDYIIANDVSNKDIGFATEDNEVFVIDKKMNIKKINKSTKEYIAKEIVEILEI